ncbi:MAG: BspA family leucine-rich repeat surface protein [Bacilli bacterium]|nr:BspA family leucine-rich repeat surface protein [Bacilli bacterium]
MKKLSYLFLLVILIIPTFVYAEESCDNKDVFIKMIELKKTTGLTEELSDVTLEDSKINLDVKMYEVGDSIEYKVIIKNDSKEDYVVDDKSTNEDNTIEYSLIPKDGTKKIKKGTEEEFTLKVIYKTEVAQEQFRSGKFDASSTVLLKVEEAKLIPIDINPKTGSIFCFLILLMIGVSIIFLFKIKNKKLHIFFLSILMLLPVSVLADCSYNIELNSNIIIGYVKPNPCTYDGELVQGAEYVNGQYTYRYMQEYGYNNSTSLYEWQNIENDGWAVRLSDTSSTDPVTSRLCTSINDKPIVSMQDMFYYSKTTSIDTSSFDTSNVINMKEAFAGCSNLEMIDVTNFDTGNVKNMTSMFGGCSSLTELNLSSFDLRGASSFSAISGNIFGGTSSLKKLNLSNMKLPADMSHAIFRSGLMSSSPIEEIDVTGWYLSNTTNAYGLFAANGSNGLGGTGLKRIIGLDTWDTSHITNMSQMFQGLSSLTTLDLSNFNTSKVTNMDEMFKRCSDLIELNLSGFDLRGNNSFSAIATGIFGETSSLKKLNLSNMKLPADMANAIFRYGSAYSSPIEEIDVTGWDLSNTTDASGMFGINGSNGLGGTGLKRIIGLDTWNTSHITNMNNMFVGLSSLESLDLSSFDTSNVTNMGSMFSDCSSLTELDLSGFDLREGNSFTSIAGGIFGGTSSLKKLNLSNMKLPADMSHAIFRFGSANSSPIEEIDVTGWDLSNTTNANGMLGANGSNGLGGTGLKRIIGLDTWDTSKVTNMSYMFQGLSSLTTLDLSNFDTSNVTNMEAMFYGCSGLTEINVTNFDTSNVTNMPAMFLNCNSLTDIDVSNFDTSNATNIASMFSGCSSLTELDLSGFDLRAVNSFGSIAGSIFSGTSSLKKLNLSNMKLPADMSHAIFRSGQLSSSPIEEIDVTGWDLSNTTNAYGMFAASGSNGLGGTGLKRIIGLDTWDTSHITDMSQMFQGLSSLTTLDLSSFNTSNVTRMDAMFLYCSSLTQLDLSNFNTSNVTNVSSMFNNCISLTTLDLSSFNTSNVTNTDDMFNGCTSVTTAYGRTNTDITKLNASRNKPSNINFVLKS